MILADVADVLASTIVRQKATITQRQVQVPEKLIR
jgi:hypothetical protein